jgi:hypothetical protein
LLAQWLQTPPPAAGADVGCPERDKKTCIKPAHLGMIYAAKAKFSKLDPYPFLHHNLTSCSNLISPHVSMFHGYTPGNQFYGSWTSSVFMGDFPLPAARLLEGTSHYIPLNPMNIPIKSHYIPLYKSYQSSIKSHCIPLNPMNIPWYPYYISIKSPFFSGILHPPWPAVTWDLHPLHEGSGIRRRGDAKPRYEGHMQGGEHLVHARPGKWSTGSFSRMAMGYPLLMV